MKVSSATAGLPVWRAAMISSGRARARAGRAARAGAEARLALAAADRDQRVERLETGLDRLVNRLPRDDARRLDFDAAALGGIERAAAGDLAAPRGRDAAP